MKTISRKVAAAVLAVLVIALGGPDAVAQEKPATRWYGYQGATTDVVAAGFLVAAIKTFRLCLNFSWDSSSATRSSCDNSTSDAFLVASLATYGLGGPVSHAANGHWDSAGYSLALRGAPFLIGAPLVSASPGAGAAVMLAGVPIAMIIDDAVLANEKIGPTDTALRVTPAYDPRAHTGALLLSGRF